MLFAAGTGLGSTPLTEGVAACTWKVKAFELTLPGLTTVTVQLGEASPSALKAGSVSWLELLKVAVLFE